MIVQITHLLTIFTPTMLFKKKVQSWDRDVTRHTGECVPMSKTTGNVIAKLATRKHKESF